ncbi:hypothetical protein C5L34_001877 [Lentilactobacillus hilgardii]|uniref:Uncharacterized protein n=1 Tax=Lentilactobacillus hilgardii (strain ATCC 8290 / DSM 20176 / CCUG 30140 / JCM 1155 / KCTC 3500 / NBRC 15886 / NCIMB 8040 / NRRL B-1843 / 9) TaxID=1423757 RepID=C0XIU3_LENH9|nr:hypothetical protein HMPREF0519_1154 [Lentilactobacillus hilgardii DSM 20176 = ATCC 8290]TDG83355.1 hypothetical protein C5L34_001877 [Lentilactobacillus hilgardii]
MDFGEQLQIRRKQLNLTQAQLAQNYMLPDKRFHVGRTMQRILIWIF